MTTYRFNLEGKLVMVQPNRIIFPDWLEPPKVPEEVWSYFDRMMRNKLGVMS